MIINYSPTGLEKDNKLYDLGLEFEEYYNTYVLSFKSIINPKYKENRINGLYCLEEALDSMLFYKLCAEELSNEEIVYDIGANTNVQKFFFDKKGVKFVGIDTHVPYKFEYYTNNMILKQYPFHITNYYEVPCCVSHLCLGYLIEINEETISYLRDFKTIIFQYSYITDYELKQLSKYFNISKCFEEYERGCFKLERK